MNIMHKLTIRHLLQNKRRTLVTIIGVIISVAMITAVATLGVSFMELFQKQVIAREGEWHVQYNNVNRQQLETVKNDPDTKTLVISRDLGYALLEAGQNNYKPYLFIREYNTPGFNQLPVELSAGRFPQAANEIVISEEIVKTAKVKYEIGDSINLKIGQRFRTVGEGREQALTQYSSLATENGKKIEVLEGNLPREYTVVGVIKRPVWEPTWAPGYTIISYVDESMLNPDDTVNAIVVLNKVKDSLYAHARDLARQNNIEKVEFHNSLLRFYGVTDNDQLRDTLYSLSAIIMTVIVIGSIALIYNAFAISVSERTRHLGMLSSVGATKRQKRNSVFFEGAVIGLISIPLGVIAGLGGIGITFLCINPLLRAALNTTETLTVTITPLSILVAIAVSVITVFISTYLPARKASRISAIDAIRQTTDVRLTAKNVKTSKLVRRIFGIEADIGLKNLKRNRRRYQATLFSLVISIVLFLAVSFFGANLTKSLELSQDGINYDISVSWDSASPEEDQRLVQSIALLDNVTKHSVVREFMLYSWINEEAIAEELRQYAKEKDALTNGKYPYYLQINTLDEASLREYAREAGADYDLLVNPDTLAAIIIDTIPYQDRGAGKFVETKAIKTNVGQSIELYHADQESEEKVYLDTVKVAALTDRFPMGVFPVGVGGLNIIISEQALEHLLAGLENANASTRIALVSTDPMATQYEIENMTGNNLYVFNVYQMRQQEEQMLLIMSIFTYGFIVLITAISMANIFNTISTSLALRKREFAMLRSVGMTPQSFNKMINYESTFYGIKSLSYGLPLSIIVMYLIHRSLMNSFSYEFALPWHSFVYVIAAVFVIVTSAMLYSSAKIKKENIIDALRQENI